MVRAVPSRCGRVIYEIRPGNIRSIKAIVSLRSARDFRGSHGSRSDEEDSGRTETVQRFIATERPAVTERDRVGQ